jgi:hypothetical protein
MLLTIFLYGLLGLLLALAGVGVVDNPLGFIAIMAVVAGIDIASKVNC